LLIRHSKSVPYYQKYTPTDSFFCDFAHWVWSPNNVRCSKTKKKDE